MHASYLLDVCWTFAGRLLDICSMFARSCERGIKLITEWLGGVMVVSNLLSNGRGFSSRSGHHQVVTTWMGDCL